MQINTGKISLIQMEPNGERAAQLECNPKLTPRPGQYLQAYNPDEPDSALGWSLFPVGLPTKMGDSKNSDRLTLAPIPKSWHPGSTLELRGPLGRGFDLPAVRRLALIALGESAARLLPLVRPALNNKADIVVFSAAPLPTLPAAIEIQTLKGLPEVISWADFFALDLPVQKLPTLRKTLGLDHHDPLPGPAQALITIPMPCAGIGECGACAVPLRRKGYSLVCKDGPVFNLNQLDW
jgi:NAD(P)H-flavin reductase